MKKALKAFDFQGFFLWSFHCKTLQGQLTQPVPKPERNAKETARLFFRHKTTILSILYFSEIMIK